MFDGCLSSREAMSDEQVINWMGMYAGLLAASEIGLGGLLHVARIPLRGHLLSLNQIFVLMQASLTGGPSQSHFSPLTISSIAACLKSLTPMGSKLTPMLAISMQGLLFNIGILAFGHSTLGRLTGGVLASFWAFIQPLCLYGIIFGISGAQTLLKGIQELSRYFSLSEELWLYIGVGFILMKVILVIIGALILPSLRSLHLQAYIQRLSAYMPKTQEVKRSAWQSAIREICNPFFLVLTVSIAGVAFYHEESYLMLAKHVLQPVALGLLMFFILRFIPLKTWTQRLEKKAAYSWVKTFRIALNLIGSQLPDPKISSKPGSDQNPSSIS